MCFSSCDNRTFFEASLKHGFAATIRKLKAGDIVWCCHLWYFAEQNISSVSNVHKKYGGASNEGEMIRCCVCFPEYRNELGGIKSVVGDNINESRSHTAVQIQFQV